MGNMKIGKQSLRAGSEHETTEGGPQTNLLQFFVFTSRDIWHLYCPHTSCAFVFLCLCAYLVLSSYGRIFIFEERVAVHQSPLPYLFSSPRRECTKAHNSKFTVAVQKIEICAILRTTVNLLLCAFVHEV